MRISLENESSAPDVAANPSDEEIQRLRRERVAAMAPREKLLYFLDYYKIPVIAAAAILLFVVLLVRDITGNLPNGFYAALINSGLYQTGEFEAAFAEAAGIDTAREDVLIDADQFAGLGAMDQTSVLTMEKLTVRLASGELDVLAAPMELFTQYANEDAYLDLREVLSDEALSFYAPYLVEAAVQVEEGVFVDSAPRGVRIDSAPRLKDFAAVPTDDLVIGILANSAHRERAVAFLNFLFERSVGMTGKQRSPL